MVNQIACKLKLVISELQVYAHKFLIYVDVGFGDLAASRVE